MAWAIDILRRYSGTNRGRILLVISLIYTGTDHFIVTSVSIRRHTKAEDDSDNWNMYAFPTPILRLYNQNLGIRKKPGKPSLYYSPRPSNMVSSQLATSKRRSE